MSILHVFNQQFFLALWECYEDDKEFNDDE